MKTFIKILSFVILIPGLAISLNGQITKTYKITLNDDKSTLETVLLDKEIVYLFNDLTDTLSLYIQKNDIAISDIIIEVASKQSNDIIFVSNSKNNQKTDGNQIRLNLIFSEVRKSILKNKIDNQYKIRIKYKDKTQDILSFKFK